jgi:hypothetical protein
MNTAFDTEIDPRHATHAEEDREISLGAATILGIFFVLAMVCAAFFGFGYTLGRKSVQNTGLQAGISPSAPPIKVKPAAGSVADQSSAVQVVTGADSSATPNLTAVVATASTPAATDKPSSGDLAQRSVYGADRRRLQPGDRRH